MSVPNPIAARQFAVEVVRQLRAAGYEALWAGGCVRDQLLGHVPKDYDVATSALPEQVRQVFGRRRTLAIGQSFGVITVLGPKEAGQMDVATFRRDAAYSDGRHPDSVSFSTAEFDAQRRDFTINGLFFEPLTEQVIDYVGGQDDLQRRVIRAIGDPLERIAEDKLRMLRAVRFAATFDFAIDRATLAAVQAQAHELVIVSAERIAAELRRMLVHQRRALALRLLQESGLLEVILPESVAWFTEDSRLAWNQTLAILDAIGTDSRSLFRVSAGQRELTKQTPGVFGVALAAVIRTLPHEGQSTTTLAQAVCRRWKLANDELDGLMWCLAHEATIRNASQTPWPQLQRILVAPRIEELLTYSAAVAGVLDGSTAEIDFCFAKLQLPQEQLNPLPLITGDDLRKLGIPTGPAYREILEQVRDAQLLSKVTNREEALKLVDSLRETHQPP